ncbi:hypothetical protein SELMODRAFT_126428 [Selaginella moellendorffii]|uniref:Expansin-like EG45 domain-containing protein n=1 Tax=Selaginella moellendorffii TaxID=88036 RepID=D8SWC8_SELML|nr:expansin-B16 isoform X2 [Selaginella moellendorffii]EFJ11203.1 hypothetical protein SELMODRAFT_126428 [Selaginella moellendorffii]|eukprot:XP_002987628.1 expansin-B16 isoform X2 [Selaginella moellendorffii]
MDSASLWRLIVLLLAAVDVARCRFHAYARGWQLATATWYGSPSGAGTDGGACGYGELPNTPYGLDVGAGSPVLFKNGRGCGACYKVRCLQQQLCSGKAVTVVITDECPGGYCAFGRTHFDLSGTAFGRMAMAGRTNQLLGSGVMQVLYKRVDCNYGSRPMEFQVNEGSTPFWLSILVRYAAGPGDLGHVELMQAGSRVWQPMTQVWGATWCFNGGPLRGPFSFRVTTLSTSETVVARNVIPRNWASNTCYRSRVNFR